MAAVLPGRALRPPHGRMGGSGGGGAAHSGATRPPVAGVSRRPPGEPSAHAARAALHQPRFLQVRQGRPALLTAEAAEGVAADMRMPTSKGTAQPPPRREHRDPGRQQADSHAPHYYWERHAPSRTYGGNRQRIGP